MSLKEQPKRLGKGLAALLGDAAHAATPAHVPGGMPAPAGAPPPGNPAQTLPVEMLEPSPFQPRRAMDEGMLAELAASIAERGILQPLLVRVRPDKAGTYQIIAGERRWRAAQRAGLHEVPVLVRKLSDSEAMAAGLVENLQRQDLNPVEEAEGYNRLTGEFGLTQEQLGQAVGKSRTHITNTLRLLALPPPVLVLLRDGKLTAGHARPLIGRADAGEIAARIVDKGMSVRQAEAAVASAGDAAARSNDKIRMSRTGDPETEALARTLTEKLGLAVSITFNGKSGTVKLAYRSLDQLDGLLELLNGR